MTRRWWVAVAFLTRCPTPSLSGVSGEDVGRSTAWFPAVCTLLGAFEWSAARLLQLGAERLDGSVPPMLLATLSSALYVRVTGALHQDAVADMADGFGGGRDRESVLRIMRDHVVGAYGSLALTLWTIARIAALAVCFERGRALPALLVAGALSRVPSLWLASWLPYAASSGVGQSITAHGGSAQRWTATLTTGAVLGACHFGFSRAVAPVVVSVLLIGLCCAWALHTCRRRLGGVTGDTLGALSALCEVAVLGAWCCV